MKMIKKMKQKKCTIVSLKFWFWLSMGIDALAVGVIYSARSSDIKILVCAAAVMAAQIIHGIRVAFFNKTVGNMSSSFCLFQFMLLILMSLGIMGDLDNTYGNMVFLLCVAEFMVALIIYNRHKIIDFTKKILVLD